MPVREVIHIDEEKCDGCGDCVVACEEGAIRIIDGKARLISDKYCDGFGNCLGECPQGAITIERREAVDFDEEAVKRHLARNVAVAQPQPSACPAPPATGGCPGAAMRQMHPAAVTAAATEGSAIPSQLGQWPVQLMLVPPHAPYLAGADLLICADCVPFAVPDFHTRYLRGRAVLVGCPKLDDLPFYYEKLKEIFAQARPRRITVLRMEVPCCGGISSAVARARDEMVPVTPLEIHTVGIQGGMIEETIPVVVDSHERMRSS
ncbi:MAG TPA: 4Fe-4S dicluster domain-containing protein [Acidobacteriota bacterium]|nr:4Fe-4S dicluster domain-containing protein [Acidobacteriota bacterium]